MVNIIRFSSKLCGEVFLNIEVVLGICIRQILVVRVLGDIKLVRHERTHAAKLQDALTSIEDGKIVYRCKIFAQLLIVEGVGNLSATAFTCVECVDCFLAERLVQFFQRGRLRAAEENTTIHVADDRIGIILVQSLELRLRLQNEGIFQCRCIRCVIFNAVAWFMSAKWAALTAAILYVVGGVLGFSNLIFLLPSLILFMSVERELYRPFLRYTSVMWVVFFQKWCRMEVA